jgi:hypothetical protein
MGRTNFFAYENGFYFKFFELHFVTEVYFYFRITIIFIFETQFDPCKKKKIVFSTRRAIFFSFSTKTDFWGSISKYSKMPFFKYSEKFVNPKLYN